METINIAKVSVVSFNATFEYLFVVFEKIFMNFS